MTGGFRVKRPGISKTVHDSEGSATRCVESSIEAFVNKFLGAVGLIGPVDPGKYSITSATERTLIDVMMPPGSRARNQA
jgi:hypothetical protein